ncbi:MAG TPA: SAM-dependent methyltransferase [Kiritimatiellia bacterium]|nr:SAM-dependent methyltransferase [Kiritimatiellia bacterium]
MSGSGTSLLLLCRPELTSSLADELLHRRIPPAAFAQQQSGWIHLKNVDPALAAEPFIFERQRIWNAATLPASHLHPLDPTLADRILGDLPRPHRLWTCHTMTAPADEEPALPRHADGLFRTILRLGKSTRPDLEKRYCTPERAARRLRDLDLLQLMLTPETLWYGVHPLTDLSVPHPGGILRRKQSPDAPSRSALKLEEAFARLGDEPQPGQTVVDLGAAPGGWSYACAVRGARVLAVDHGPLKGWPAQSPLVTHIRANGLTFRPPPETLPVDWLVADMLIAPSQALAMLQPWIDHSLARRFVINLKLPQQQPFPALLPILEAQSRWTHLHTTIRHLYHDRREVTLIAVHRDNKPSPAPHITQHRGSSGPTP